MSDPDPPLIVNRLHGYLPITHEALCDYTDHVCDDTCPPRWVPPPLMRGERITIALRTLAWRIRRLPGYRLVHLDDIGCNCDDWER